MTKRGLKALQAAFLAFIAVIFIIVIILAVVAFGMWIADQLDISNAGVRGLFCAGLLLASAASIIVYCETKKG